MCETCIAMANATLSCTYVSPSRVHSVENMGAHSASIMLPTLILVCSASIVSIDETFLQSIHETFLQSTHETFLCLLEADELDVVLDKTRICCSFFRTSVFWMSGLSS